VTKIEEYRKTIQNQANLQEYLLANSNLPGPRGNLELAQAAALEAPAESLTAWSEIGPELAPVNTPAEFITFCGVLGQGRLYLEGDAKALTRIRKAANDSRWRTREAAAMALQMIGVRDIQILFQFLPDLARGTAFEQRCAVAAICEPVLLSEPSSCQFALDLLDAITKKFEQSSDRKSERFVALKKGLSYGWSVAIAAAPAAGKVYLEKWLKSEDKDTHRVMMENLKKNRLRRLEEFQQLIREYNFA